MDKTAEEIGKKMIRRTSDSAGGIRWAMDLADKLIAERVPRETVIPHAFRIHLIKELRAAYGAGFRDGEKST